MNLSAYISDLHGRCSQLCFHEHLHRSKTACFSFLPEISVSCQWHRMSCRWWNFMLIHMFLEPFHRFRPFFSRRTGCGIDGSLPKNTISSAVQLTGLWQPCEICHLDFTWDLDSFDRPRFPGYRLAVEKPDLLSWILMHKARGAIGSSIRPSCFVWIQEVSDKYIHHSYFIPLFDFLFQSICDPVTLIDLSTCKYFHNPGLRPAKRIAVPHLSLTLYSIDVLEMQTWDDLEYWPGVTPFQSSLLKSILMFVTHGKCPWRKISNHRVLTIVIINM